MTREQAKELLPVMQAFAEGKELQVCYEGCHHGWEDHGGDIAYFDNLGLKWRIKPEPRDWWIHQSKGGRENPAFAYREEPITSNPSMELIHVREVLD